MTHSSRESTGLRHREGRISVSVEPVLTVIAIDSANNFIARRIGLPVCHLLILFVESFYSIRGVFPNESNTKIIVSLNDMKMSNNIARPSIVCRKLKLSKLTT